jgi:hypothetical protein
MGQEIEVVIDKDGKIKIETLGVENCMAAIEKILENIMDLNEIVHVTKTPKSPNYNTQKTDTNIDVGGEN